MKRTQHDSDSSSDSDPDVLADDVHDNDCRMIFGAVGSVVNVSRKRGVETAEQAQPPAAEKKAKRTTVVVNQTVTHAASVYPSVSRVISMERNETIGGTATINGHPVAHRGFTISVTGSASGHDLDLAVSHETMHLIRANRCIYVPIINTDAETDEAIDITLGQNRMSELHWAPVQHDANGGSKVIQIIKQRLPIK